jgi:hypothetical protein
LRQLRLFRRPFEWGLLWKKLKSPACWELLRALRSPISSGTRRLPEARKRYLDRFLEVYGGDPFLVRLLIESGRFIVYHLVAVLDAAQDPARRETWATVGLLKQQLARIGLASGRHVDHLVARLCAVGFMELRPAEQDRRVRILKPTEKLHAHDRDWLVAHYAPLTVLYPQYDYGLVMRRDPQFQTVHRRASVSFMAVGSKIMLSASDMMLFFHHAAGYPVIAALLQAAMAAGDDPHTAVPYADIGDRFGVSRTHVRKLLVAAEEMGLVKLHARGGQRVEILPRLWSSHDFGMAGGMYYHDALYIAASRAYAAAATARPAAAG